MPTYIEAQAEISDRFSAVAKLAKLRRRDLDLVNDRDSRVFDTKSEIAAQAVDRLVGVAVECLSLEAQRWNSEPDKELAPKLQSHFEQVGEKLDFLVGSGSTKLDERRAFLLAALPYATAGRHTDLDFEEIAKHLNGLHISPVDGGSVLILGSRVERSAVNRPVLVNHISDEEAKDAIAGMRDLCEDLNGRVRLNDNFHLLYLGDDIRQFRDQPSVDGEISKMEDALSDDAKRISLRQDVLTSVSDKAVSRQLRTGGIGSDTSLSLTPLASDGGDKSSMGPVAGMKRSRVDGAPSTVDEELPVSKRRGNASARGANHLAHPAQFDIYTDPEPMTIPAISIALTPSPGLIGNKENLGERGELEPPSTQASASRGPSASRRPALEPMSQSGTNSRSTSTSSRSSRDDDGFGL